MPVQIRDLLLVASSVPKTSAGVQSPNAGLRQAKLPPLLSLGRGALESRLPPDRCALDSTFPGRAPLRTAPRLLVPLLESSALARTFGLKSDTVKVPGRWSWWF